MSAEMIVRPFDEGDKGKWVTHGLSFFSGTDQLNFLDIESPQYGRLKIGEYDDKHKGWRWAETGGGGPITLLYSFDPDAQLLIGLLLEDRINLGGLSLCVMGGFKEPTETHDESQKREALEESGIDTSDANLLPGKPSVANRNYFWADQYKRQGIPAYAHKMPFDQLEPAESGAFKIRDSFSDFKKAELVRFLDWRRAIQDSCDGIARSGMAQLVAHLLKFAVWRQDESQ